MLEWAVSSAVLTALVIALRYILRGRISLRLQYALWGLVLLRLLLPVSLGSSRMSVMNALPEAAGTASPPVLSAVPAATAAPRPAGSAAPADAPPAVSAAEEAKPAPAASGSASPDVRRLLRGIWLGGAALLLLWFLAVDLRFGLRLRRSRRALEGTGCPLPVYVSEAARTPCLFGLLRPAVYLPPEAAADPALDHILAHEQTHRRHGDAVWSLLRGLALALHWYDPLVWWAAFLSRRDGELACDEGTLLRLGEDQRAEYGRTLLRVTCARRPELLTTATTMHGGGLKERIRLIVKEPRTTAVTLGTVLCLAALALGCTFTGAKTADAAERPTLPHASPDSVIRIEGLDMRGYTVQAAGNPQEIGRQWAEACAGEYLRLPGEDPLSCRTAETAECTLLEESLLDEPRRLVFYMRFVCEPVNRDAFLRDFSWSRPAEPDPEQPERLTFDFRVLLEKNGSVDWTCSSYGTLGWQIWGFLDYEHRDMAEQHLDMLMEGTLPEPEYALAYLPFADLWAFAEKYGTEGLSALAEKLAEISDSRDQMQGPEDTRHWWRENYPEDQSYRDLYMMLTLRHTDESIARYFGPVLTALREADKQRFRACLDTLDKADREYILALTEGRPAEGRPSLSLHHKDVTLHEGDSFLLSATLVPELNGETVTWFSQDPSVAAVDGGGFVTAVSAGTTRILVTAGDETAECIVRVLSSYTAPDPAETFPRNERGETYGPPMVLPDGTSLEPDLILTIGRSPDGAEEVQGYLRREDMHGTGPLQRPKNPKEAMVYMEQLEELRQEALREGRDYIYSVPLYDSDGVTVIGYFGVGSP